MAGGSKDVPITFKPLTDQSYSGVIAVNCDKTEGNNTISVSGRGFIPVHLPAIFLLNLLSEQTNSI